MANPAIPPEVSQYAQDWPLANKDYGSTRATKDSTINSSNVNNLKLAWSIPMTAVGPAGSIATTPIIMGNNVYFQDLEYSIYSADFSTGKVNWTHKANTPWIGPNGVAVGWGKVFGALDWYHMGALDMKDGSEVWKTQLASPDGPNYMYINIQPIPYDGMVYTSDSPHVTYDVGGMIGYIFGMNQDTGLVEWALSTVDSANLWGHPELNSGGGCWQSPSVDTNTGITYWGTANPGNGTGPNGPYSGTADFPNGSSRPGPNLYTNALLAVDHTSGKLLWWNQTFPHDIYDHDFMNPPVLGTAMIAGKERDMVFGSGKAGVVFGFDRANGGTVWKMPVGKHQNDTLAELPDQYIEVYPGILGGVETPMAYADGIVFAAYDDIMSKYSSTGFGGAQPVNEATGGIAALDAATGKILWDNKLDSLAIGACTVVNDLVFTATYTGDIYAFDTKTGGQVFKYTAPAGINGWPAVAKDTIIWPCGSGANPAVIALRLGG